VVASATVVVASVVVVVVVAMVDSLSFVLVVVVGCCSSFATFCMDGCSLPLLLLLVECCSSSADGSAGSVLCGAPTSAAVGDDGGELGLSGLNGGSLLGSVVV